MMTFTPMNWASTSRELVTQTRRWTVTMRDMSVGSLQGVFGSSQVLQESTKPFFDVVTTTHDQMLDMWENSALAAIDQTSKMTDSLTPEK